MIRASGGKRIIARGVNISASGLFVHCVEPTEIGSNIMCAVLLDGGPRKLAGRITRLEALPGMIGVAIAFCDLSARDVTALRGYVGLHRLEAVEAKIHLLGMASPVRCQAVYDGDTIRLSTALPFLRLDSEVGVHRECDPDDATTNGVLSRVTLEPTLSDGVPRLALDVDVTHARRLVPVPAGHAAPAQPGATGARRDRRSPAPLPSVVLSSTLQTETLAMTAGRLLGETPPHRHDTAEVPRPWHFKDWSYPPAITEGARPGRRKRRLSRRASRFFTPLESLTGLPFWASCLVALLFGFVTALIFR